MSIENFSSITAAVSGGFFGGILLGYALKKVIRIAAVVVGLFIAGLVYLQHQQIASINWDKLGQMSEVVVDTVANAVTDIVEGGHPEVAEVAELVITNFSIPLTGSVSIGFTI